MACFCFVLLCENLDILQKNFYNNDHRQCDQKKSQNVFKSCPKMISLEKWKGAANVIIFDEKNLWQSGFVKG